MDRLEGAKSGTERGRRKKAQSEGKRRRLKGEVNLHARKKNALRERNAWWCNRCNRSSHRSSRCGKGGLQWA
jgi:hypothetical protein